MLGQSFGGSEEASFRVATVRGDVHRSGGLVDACRRERVGGQYWAGRARLKLHNSGVGSSDWCEVEGELAGGAVGSLNGALAGELIEKSSGVMRTVVAPDDPEAVLGEKLMSPL